MSYNNRHWHDEADDVDRYRKKDELLDEEAESRTLHIEFDVLYKYYENKVIVTLTSTEFDGELTFETTTGNKARQAIDDLEQWDEEDEKVVEPPKAIPPPSSYYIPPIRSAPPSPSPQRPAQSQQQQSRPAPQAQSQPQPQTVNVHEQVQRREEANANPLLDIATDIAEILKLGAQLKPKVDKLRKK